MKFPGIGQLFTSDYFASFFEIDAIMVDMNITDVFLLMTYLKACEKVILKYKIYFKIRLLRIFHIVLIY